MGANKIWIDGTAPPDGGRGSGPSAPRLFSLLWDSLADLLGTATTATLISRSAKRAIPTCPELSALVVVREKLEYHYVFPGLSTNGTDAELIPLRRLVDALLPLLAEMTGPIGGRRLTRIPEFLRIGLVPPQQ